MLSLKNLTLHERCHCSNIVLLWCQNRILPLGLRALVKLALLPIIVGIGYELIKFAGRHDNLLTRIISMPGVWLQHLTVFEPDDAMIECAIIAVERVIPDDGSDNW